jgi:L,D-peptidoglycan transpeptidase YkuD (ErfK/YbiS/YcfS/YnhG family)
MLRLLPTPIRFAMRRYGIRPTRHVLRVSVRQQRMDLFERRNGSALYARPKRCVISTSAFGIGQQESSNQTPLGLHRIARKIGGGTPPGTVFRSRVPIGLAWEGMADAKIVHRILWLEGLELGFNQGGSVDSFRRYIYIHGFADESTLGRPASHGCVHMAARDLLPLFDKVREGTLVYISEH